MTTSAEQETMGNYKGRIQRNSGKASKWKRRVHSGQELGKGDKISFWRVNVKIMNSLAYPSQRPTKQQGTKMVQWSPPIGGALIG